MLRDQFNIFCKLSINKNSTSFRLGTVFIHNLSNRLGSLVPINTNFLWTPLTFVRRFGPLIHKTYTGGEKFIRRQLRFLILLLLIQNIFSIMNENFIITLIFLWTAHCWKVFKSCVGFGVTLLRGLPEFVKSLNH